MDPYDCDFIIGSPQQFQKVQKRVSFRKKVCSHVMLTRDTKFVLLEWI